MGFIQDETATVNAEIAAKQARLAILATLPADTYPFGTVAIFAWNNGREHYIKVEEEEWRPMQGASNITKELAYWVYIKKTTDPSVYFEVYIMTAAALPIYSS